MGHSTKSKTVRIAGLFAICLGTLAACSTPQERCARDLNRQLTTVTDLIAETEVNLERGYGYVNEIQNTSVGFTGCVGGWRYYGSGLRFCGSSEPRVVQRAVPIDPEIERRKLEGLRDRQVELQDLTSRAAAVCIERFPA